MPVSGDSERPRRLLLVADAECNHEPSFLDLAGRIATRAPSIHCVVTRDRRLRARRWAYATRPTLVFSPLPLHRFRPVRGRVYQGRHLRKSEEYEALEAADVRVPRWTLLGPGGRPDLSDFPEYVVTKPDLGLRGAEVKIRRRGRVRWKPPERPLPHGDDRLLVQEFVYTGRWPVSYRVTSLFGHVLASWRVEADHSRRPLEAPDAFAGGERGGGMSIVSSGRGSVFSLCDDPAILAFGAEAHRAFPDVPLLGVDIVRDARTGDLFVLEVNASGYVWHLDSVTGRGIQRDHGIDFRAQFGFLERAAEVLAARTLAEAR